MRVLIVHPSFWLYGGAELVIVRLCNQLAKMGVECDILTSQIIYSVKRDIQSSNIIIPKEVFKYDPILALRDHLRQIYLSYDVINFHNTPAEQLLYPIKYRTVWTCNEPPLYILYGGKPSKEYVKIVRDIRTIVVSDELNKNRFISLFGDHDIRINHYGVDYEYFSVGRYNIIPELEDAFTILQVGIVHDMKNQARSVIALKRLAKQIPNIKLVLAGYLTEPYTTKLKQLISRFDLNHNVIFTGDISRQKLRDYYYNADVLLHPIRAQGGWLAPFEALSCELLPIVSNEAPCSTLMWKRGIGIVTNEYEKAILSYYNDPSKYSNIISRGKLFTKQYMRWSRYAKNMLSIYEELLES